MKVFIVQCQTEEQSYVVGVYSSNKKAREVIKVRTSMDKYVEKYDIVESELDQ